MPARTLRSLSRPRRLPVPRTPTRFLAARDDRLFPLFQRRVVAERLGLEVEVIVGGHLSALTQPGPIAEL